MDSIKLKQLITENMKSIFGFALTRLGNVNDAEYLASDILYEIIKSAKNLKDEERFYGFMWKIAENTYKGDYLRKKLKFTSCTAELDENIADESDSALTEIIKEEDLNLLLVIKAISRCDCFILYRKPLLLRSGRQITDQHGNGKILFVPCKKNHQRGYEYGKIIRRKKLSPKYL